MLVKNYGIYKNVWQVVDSGIKYKIENNFIASMGLAVIMISIVQIFLFNYGVKNLLIENYKVDGFV